MGPSSKSPILEIYARLYRAFGPQHWWPGETPLEIIVGAILTQNTNWGNVEKAIANLKRNRCLSAQALHAITAQRLASHIKPAGYFNVKAKRLKNFIDMLFKDYKGSLKLMGKEPIAALRPKLLCVNGIGPETADSILLYAFQKPAFVVDAYTKRFLVRHNLASPKDNYCAIKSSFTEELKPDRKMFNEYHALIVKLGKEYCRPNALCAQCPLNDVHYSLIHKCGKCHRALPRASDRKTISKKTFCRDCSLH